MNRGIVIQPIFNHNIDNDYKLEEAINLSKSLDIYIADSIKINLKKINPSTFLYKGNLDKIKNLINNLNINIIVINSYITAIQQRNLENLLNTKVLDRNGVIINIFSLRAQSSEGKLQSKLAYLTYQKSRLVKAWNHLERQRGGGGFIGGPGETQKELDKRLIEEQITTLKTQIQKIKINKKTQASSRKKNSYITVALAGYTNSGKSTLFNTLTSANIIAKDLLFSTLDTTLRLLKINNKTEILLLDSVGFISDLPHQLIQAFHSTLYEIKEADIILHIIDASNIHYQDQIQDVKKVLYELNINSEIYNKKVIEVYNKIDLLTTEQFDNLTKSLCNSNVCFISAKNSLNLDSIKNKIFDIITNEMIFKSLKIHYNNIDLLSYIYNNCILISKKNQDNFLNLEFKIDKKRITHLNNLISQFKET